MFATAAQVSDNVTGHHLCFGFFLCVVLFVELFVLFVWFSLDVYNFTIEGIFTVFFRWISQPNLQEM